jgi:hypothetical protein
MTGLFESGWLLTFRTLNQIFTAGVAITAFALLLYALTFNLRDRVARSFALILVSIVCIYSGQALSFTYASPLELTFWLNLLWIGTIFVPASYFYFSDALLATTGKPSRGRRRWVVRLTFLVSAVFLLLQVGGRMVGPLEIDALPVPYLAMKPFAQVFVLYYSGVMAMAWFNLVRALQRTITPTSRRRMLYLLGGAAAPVLGSYPYIFFGPQLFANHVLVFWTLATLLSLLVGTLTVVMAYTVAFFGVNWPDRVVKTRLFSWLLRGPFTASVVLGITTIVRRAGAILGMPYTVLVPLLMVALIVLMEAVITLLGPLWERMLFLGKDQKDLELLAAMQDRLLTSNDLSQFLEVVLAAGCDRLQAPSAFAMSINHGEGQGLLVRTGKNPFFENDPDGGHLLEVVTRGQNGSDFFYWQDYLLVPLHETEMESNSILLGLMGFYRKDQAGLDEEQTQAIKLLGERAALALRDRQLQRQVFQALQALSPRVQLIQQLSAAARFDRSRAFDEDNPVPSDFSTTVKEALTHYWGGPKLQESPLLQLKIVKDALKNHDGNAANAMRAILRQAIEQVRPEGERRFTAEWLLYNLLEMKFIEGRKVREVASRLAMSEADLYRKQRVAIEVLAKIILEMEQKAQTEAPI